MREFTSQPHRTTLGRERRRRPVAQRRVRTQRVIYHPPFLDHHLCFPHRIKNLSVRAFVPQLPVETFGSSRPPRDSRVRCTAPPSPPSPATSAVRRRRTPARCPSECSPEFP